MKIGLQPVSAAANVRAHVHLLRPAVFLDRDGTLMEEEHYCSDPEQVRIIPGVPEALRALKDAGYRLVIITNQSGIGRGYYTLADYEAVQARLPRPARRGADRRHIFLPGSARRRRSPRRKPAPGMVMEAARDLGLDLARSWFIGDKAVDVQCGRNAGMRPILVLTGHGARAGRRGRGVCGERFCQRGGIYLKDFGCLRLPSSSPRVTPRRACPPSRCIPSPGSRSCSTCGSAAPAPGASIR